MATQKFKYYAQACSKCGHVFNEYLSRSRKGSDVLRSRIPHVVAEHDARAHVGNGERLETTNIQFVVEAKVV